MGWQSVSIFQTEEGVQEMILYRLLSTYKPLQKQSFFYLPYCVLYTCTCLCLCVYTIFACKQHSLSHKQTLRTKHAVICKRQTPLGLAFRKLWRTFTSGEKWLPVNKVQTDSHSILRIVLKPIFLPKVIVNKVILFRCSPPPLSFLFHFSFRVKWYNKQEKCRKIY